jgi:branched-chain amino acid transport system ATP-binding protein
VIEDLHVRFGGVTAVDGFSFVAPAGEITGIVGPNGAGKTTVFNAVSGFLAPASGRIHIDGTDITALPPHRRAQAGAGRTFQMVGLIKGMSVRDNVLLAQHLHSDYHEAEGLLSLPRARRAERSIRDHADAAITALGFDRYADTPLGQLSHGQQRIVEIACVLAARPKVLLLDEPTAGLSPAAAEALADRLREIRDQLGQTIVLIEHHIPFVMATCSTVVVMAAGKELAAGPPAEVFEVPSVVSAYLGEAA